MPSWRAFAVICWAKAHSLAPMPPVAAPAPPPPPRPPKNLVEPQATLIERLKGQIKRHHLGQRRRIGHHIRVQLAQYLAGLGVEHDRLIGRPILGDGDLPRQSRICPDQIDSEL